MGIIIPCIMFTKRECAFYTAKYGSLAVREWVWLKEANLWKARNLAESEVLSYRLTVKVRRDGRLKMTVGTRAGVAVGSLTETVKSRSYNFTVSNLCY